MGLSDGENATHRVAGDKGAWEGSASKDGRALEPIRRDVGVDNIQVSDGTDGGKCDTGQRKDHKCSEGAE